MISAPTPVNEAARLADLLTLQILDTVPEERFDRIARLTRRVFGTPIAYIALIDNDRQWFKAKTGLPFEETPRAISFCGHAIMNDGPLVIPDATLDHRFADNPLVTGPPYTRFYAGYPLKGPAGHNVGTLCVAGPEPRTLSAAEMATFSELAALAEHELHLTQVIEAQQELLDTKDALLKAQKRLAAELDEATAYLRSLLPARLEGQVNTDWEFIASSELGGDLFGYHFLDDHRLAVYLLDVCGHGVGASLLSMAVHSALRRQALAETDFGEPASVLTALNRAFPMDDNHGKFFTIWYGVYDKSTRELHYATGGHPPAIVFHRDAGQPLRLGEPSMMIGVSPDESFESYRQQLWPGSRLYVFSDGVTDVHKPDGSTLTMDGLVALLRPLALDDAPRLGRFVQEARRLQGKDAFADDFSMVELEFA